MEFVPVRTEYAIPIEKEEAIIIQNRDWQKHNEEFDPSVNSLHDNLETLRGVSDIDYGYSPYVYLSIDVEDDTPEMRLAIEKMIYDYIEGYEDVLTK